MKPSNLPSTAYTIDPKNRIIIPSDAQVVLEDTQNLILMNLSTLKIVQEGIHLVLFTTSYKNQVIDTLFQSGVSENAYLMNSISILQESKNLDKAGRLQLSKNITNKAMKLYITWGEDQKWINLRDDVARKEVIQHLSQLLK